MDLSGLIFVALAVAWAAYLIPKAIRHHDDVARGRSIDKFSGRLRVLARREPVSSRAARLVVPAADRETRSGEGADAVVTLRERGRKAARRRRRVLALLLVGTAAVAAACVDARLAWRYLAIPVALLVAWLVACWLMARRERARRAAGRAVRQSMAPEAASTDDVPSESSAEPDPRDPHLWDPVPMTLPTYVSKPPARRTVRTIDLEASGVWTSGRTETDSAIAREADAAARERRRAEREGDGDAAVGG